MQLIYYPPIYNLKVVGHKHTDKRAEGHAESDDIGAPIRQDSKVNRRWADRVSRWNIQEAAIHIQGTQTNK